jgi:hypothetical protein
MPISQINTNSIANGAVVAADLAAGAALSNLGTSQLADANMAPGSVIQVVSSIKTDVTSYTTNINVGFASYSSTGVAASITPSSTNSKILVLVNLSVGVNSGSICVFALRRDSSFPALGNAASGYYQVTQTGRGVGGNIHGMHHSGIMYLDSPSTTSSVTYTVLGAAEGAQIVYINGSGGNDLGSQSWSSRGTSTITLLEIAG